MVARADEYQPAESPERLVIIKQRAGCSEIGIRQGPQNSVGLAWHSLTSHTLLFPRGTGFDGSNLPRNCYLEYLCYQFMPTTTGE
ncbi:hypothetical protein E2C01_038727 [Portunus trituberculatus]|uniref:Uncharacterized protein n=1 Tax=Portunus trituberculatus TaxID=210409 RepID=A0A5B7FKV0_PORTR|nr:hypothetical protein [Portunus trituberculatus]